MKIPVGDAGLSRDEIRAALHALQDSRCAICRTPEHLVVDHDHMTGFVRGLLCRICNGLEGKFDDPLGIGAYRADPPAAGRNWWWTFPDTWTEEDTAAVRQLGITVVEYLPQHLERAAARKEALAALDPAARCRVAYGDRWESAVAIVNAIPVPGRLRAVDGTEGTAS